MENGEGAAEKNHRGGLKVGDDALLKLKAEGDSVSGVHGPKDSVGEVVCDAAVQSSADERGGNINGLEPDLVDDAVCAVANDDVGSGFSAIEGSSGLGNEEEIAENGVEGFVDAIGGEIESTEERDTSSSAENGEDSVACLNDEGKVDTFDDGSTVEASSMGLGSRSLDVEGAEPVAVDGDRVEEPVIVEAMENGDTDKVVGDDSVAGPSYALEDVAANGDVKHVSKVTMELGDSSVGISSEDQLEKLEDCESHGVEDVAANGNITQVSGLITEQGDSSAGISPKDRSGKLGDYGTNETERILECNSVEPHGNNGVEDVAANGDISQVSELMTELGNSSYGLSSEDQSGKLEDHGISETEGTSESNSLEPQQNNGVTYGDLEIQDGYRKPEDNQTTSLPEHQDGNSRVEERFSDAIGSVDSLEKSSEIEPSHPLATSSVENNVKSELIASDSGTKDCTPDLLKPSVIAVGDREPTAQNHTVGEEGRKSVSATEETPKLAESAVSSSEKSASPAVPPTRPAGLGATAPLLGPAPRAAHQPRVNGRQPQAQSNVAEDANNGELEEGDEIREKLQMIRVKFLRLAHRLGQTPHNVVVAQVLYRLGLAEQLRAKNGGRFGAFSFDRASAMAEQLETTDQEPLDFSCTIMVLGKSGVGKSATINSIFDEVKFSTDAFHMGTKKVQDVVGTVQGIKVRVIDTPGLLSSGDDQLQNEKILNSVKRFIKKSPPDIVLYLDRLDMPSRDFADMPMLRTITNIFGPSIWFNAIVVLTHAASAPPEGPNGTASTYDMFVTQRSHAVQQAIRQAAGDMRLMNPVSLVENHSACRTNRAGQRVLPNGQVWKPHLLLLSFASKILAEANSLLKLQDPPFDKPFTSTSRAPPLPILLSSLLQSQPVVKLPEEQFADDDDTLDDNMDRSSNSDDESKCDELPPFKPLTKAQLSKLSKGQRKAYYDELEYRERLLMRKQMKEERRRRRMMEQMAAEAKDLMPGDNIEYIEEESSSPSSVPVPMPDLALPASFDSDNPTHRYRCLDTSNQWLVRAVLDSHGWDHDVGYEGLSIERLFVVKDKIPITFSGQFSKDKKDTNLQMEVASSIKHGEGKATTLGLDVQNAGKDMAYTLRSETRFSNYKHNKATAGVSATLLGDTLSTGVKLEDKLIVNNQFKVVMNGGAMAGRGEIAYGGNLEATFKDKDSPLGRFLSTLGLSIVDCHGELVFGGNIQTRIPVGRSTNLVARANLSNRGSGQVSLKINSSEQIQLALIGLIPLLKKLFGQSQDHHPFGH